MYFSYGWPNVYSSDCGSGDDIVYVTLDQQYLFTVSNVAVQIWSGGQHRVRLGECIRTADDVETEGENVAAFWCAAKSTLAVLTSSNYLHLYATHVWKESVFPASSFASNICKVDVYLRSSVKLEYPSRATCIGGDNRFLLVAYDDCTLSTYSWLGKFRDTCAPLDGEYYPETPGREEGSGSENGLQEVESKTRSIIQFDYVDTCKLLAMVLSDGSCAMCQVADSGFHPLSQLAFSHWVSGPSPAAVCAKIGASSQLVAVGRVSGDVALYRLHPTGGSSNVLDARVADAPLRLLSLEEWGHRSQQTGPISTVEWSPDCRALAVGYALQGLVVWSPSGCRLMCTLRQSSIGMTQSSRLLSASSNVPNAESNTSLHSLADADFTAFENGTKALAWGPLGYQLVVAEALNTRTLQEMQFAKTLPNHHRVAQSRGVLGTSGSQAGEEIHVLQAHDRLLVITEAVEAQDRQTGLTTNSMEAAAASNDLVVHHIPLPSTYLNSNWPVVHTAISPTGMDLAVAGLRGLALYSRAADRWRLFGDVSQERRIRCQGMSWLDGIIVVCSSVDTGEQKSQQPGPCELLLFPRYHLDFSSLLCRYALPQPLVAMDCVGTHILIASEPLEIALMEVVVKGPLVPSANPKAELHLVREISMLNVGRPLLDMALVPSGSTGYTGSASVSASAPASTPATPRSSGGEDRSHAPPQDRPQLPRECVLLRWGGLMSVLDMEKGSEIALSNEVEAFWLADNLPCHAQPASMPSTAYPSRSPSLNPAFHSNVSDPDFNRTGVTDNSCEPCTTGQTEVEMPWWAYGCKGMQLWFPSSFSQPQSLRTAGSNAGNDIELEFDREVYPIGISLADAAIVGITQRVVRGLTTYVPTTPGAPVFFSTAGTGQFPCFHPIPESQPVLPCLLRRLLQRGAFQEALTLAKRHERGPHFTRSLEWLLFTTLELETSKPSQKRSVRQSSDTLYSSGSLGRNNPWKNIYPSSMLQSVSVSQLLSSAADLIRQFPQFADVVVSVARKTDAQLWPALFSAVGTPSSLLECLLDMGALSSAACCLLVIDKMEGAMVAHSLALRLIKATLKRGQYALCGELLRFIIPPGEVDSLYSIRSMKSQASAFSEFSTADDRKQDAGGNSNNQAGNSWFGWLFGYGRMSNGTRPAPGPPAQQASTSADPVVDASINSALDLLTLKQEAMAGAASSASRRTTESAFANEKFALQYPARSCSGAESVASENLTPAISASHVVAEHGWQLLTHGRVGALAQLATAMSFLPGGLANLMQQHRAEVTSEALEAACLQNATAADLISALAIIVQELPVWEGDDVERAAHNVLQVYKEVGGTAWMVALAILLVDANCVVNFRNAEPVVWQQFCELAKTGSNFAYLFQIIDSLSAVSMTGSQRINVESPFSDAAAAGQIAADLAGQR